MPPRSAKRAAAKKPSARAKASPPSPPAAASAEALPSAEEEKILEAEAFPAAVAQDNTVDEDEKKPLESDDSLPEADIDPSTTVDGEGEDVEEEEVTAAEILPSEAVEDGEPAETENMGEADALQEETGDPEMSLKGEGEPSEASEEATEGDEEAEVSTEVEDDDVNSNEVNVEEGAKKSIAEEETGAPRAEDAEPCEVEVGDTMGDGDGSGSDNDSDNGDDEDDVDPTLYMNAPMTERKRNKEFEIFVGGLGKEAVEDDLLKVFGEFGEIQSARIVKHPVTQKSKGFAFVRYASVEQAKKALAGMKDGTEIRGKRVGISASMDNDTLYLGNICRTWSKDQVLETLKGFGVEPIEEILLPDDPKNEGNNKGFAFLEFSSHSDAMAAFQRLRKPDAIFGCNRSAKVAFAQFSMHPSEEVMSQVKSVYVEGIPLTWDEEKIKEMCKQYGEIEKVQLSRDFSKSKRKDFGFVAFTSHESAVACIDGINDAELGEDDIKVKASLAKPQRKGRLAKQGVRGGFKVNENGEVSKEAGQSKTKTKTKAKGTHGKGKAIPKLKDAKDKESYKSKGKTMGGKSTSQYHQKDVEPSKGGKRGRKGRGIDNGARPSKKARRDFNFPSRHSGGYRSQRNVHFGMMRTNNLTRPIQYASSYAEPVSGYQLRRYAGGSGSNQQRSDLAPHAGYLPASRQSQNSYGHSQRRNQERISAGGYDDQQRSYSGGYSNQQRPIVGGYSNPPETGASYPGAGSEVQFSYPGNSASTYRTYEAGYSYPGTGAYAPQGPYY